jgi:hypothetical protein
MSLTTKEIARKAISGQESVREPLIKYSMPLAFRADAYQSGFPQQYLDIGREPNAEAAALKAPSGVT